MTIWFTIEDAEAQERLLAAWADAPLTNLEVCGMILDVAREQVLAFGPTSDETDPNLPEPQVITLTTPVAGTVTFSRQVGRLCVVTLSLTNVALVDAWAGVTAALPFRPEAAVFWQPASAAFLFGVDGVLAQAWGSWDPDQHIEATLYALTASEDPEPIEGYPPRFVYAQLKQAENLWNAGRVASDGSVGTEGYSFTPRPLDKTIKAIIRPIDGKPDVY